jgi:hypothetical protein
MSPSFGQLPTRQLAGVTVCDTPLVRKTLEFTRKYCDDFTYNHCIRSWVFATVLCPAFIKPANNAAEEESFDHEALAVSAILHDLGWILEGDLTSPDKRFEVDSANGARQFLDTESVGWDRHRQQLVWDAIALHATPSIAMHKEPEVAAVSAGIGADFVGPAMVPGGPLQLETFHAVAKEFPRHGFQEGVKHIMCQLCRKKPETTFDNFVGDFGEKYVEGYSRAGRSAIDFMESCI